MQNLHPSKAQQLPKYSFLPPLTHLGVSGKKAGRGGVPPGREALASFSHQPLAPFCLVYWSRITAQKPLPGLMRSLDQRQIQRTPVRIYQNCFAGLS